MIPVKEASPVQQFVEIESIENDTLILKSGALRKIVLVSGINFELKSEEEQTLIIFTFQNFLNSINFPLQFFIHSRRLNIGAYLAKMEARESQEPSGLLQRQIAEYREFIKSFVSENAIMEKNFFLVVPYDPVVLPEAVSSFSSLFKIFSSKSAPRTAPAQGNAREEHMEQLNLRIDQVIAGLNQIGLRAVPLNGDELKELMRNIYNPADIEKKAAETPLIKK